MLSINGVIYNGTAFKSRILITLKIDVYLQRISFVCRLEKYVAHSISVICRTAVTRFQFAYLPNKANRIHENRTSSFSQQSREDRCKNELTHHYRTPGRKLTALQRVLALRAHTHTWIYMSGNLKINNRFITSDSYAAMTPNCYSEM